MYSRALDLSIFAGRDPSPAQPRCEDLGRSKDLAGAGVHGRV
jgi:hypothetical protein